MEIVKNDETTELADVYPGDTFELLDDTQLFIRSDYKLVCGILCVELENGTAHIISPNKNVKVVEAKVTY